MALKTACAQRAKQVHLQQQASICAYDCPSEHIQAMQACSSILMSRWHAPAGWRAALQALAVAAADCAPPVVDAALDALQPVVEALWREGHGAGHDHFADTVGAIAAAVRNPVAAPLSISAIHILQSAARRLAETPSQVPSCPPRDELHVHVGGLGAALFSGWACQGAGHHGPVSLVMSLDVSS